MALTRIRFSLAAMCMTVLAASGASAQVFGTFSWQMQPFCNVVTMTITQVPSGFTVDGFDEQCGAQTRAGFVGMALINPDGTVGVNFTLVTSPGVAGAHVAAVISPVTGSGTWIDSVGNVGNFVLAGAVPALPPRPTPSSGVGPSSITSVEIATGAVGASEIAAGAVGASEIVADSITQTHIANNAVRSSELGTISQRSAVSATIAPDTIGSATASCLAGEQFLSGGNSGSNLFNVFVIASRRSGNGWAVFVHNKSGGIRTVTAHVYCLLP